MAFALPPLPFPKDALEPFVSAETLEYHHGKHHNAYVTNLNRLTEGKPEASKTLEDIVLTAEGPLFNNAAQVWNHTFYWNGLRKGTAGPQGALLDAIRRDCGSPENLIAALTDAAVTQFGSGWAWLVLEAGKLKVVKTPNADLPMKHGQQALFTVDVWEHAYYIDYRNDRPKYVSQLLTKLMNWEFIADNFRKNS